MSSTYFKGRVHVLLKVCMAIWNIVWCFTHKMIDWMLFYNFKRFIYAWLIVLIWKMFAIRLRRSDGNKKKEKIPTSNFPFCLYGRGQIRSTLFIFLSFKICKEYIHTPYSHTLSIIFSNLISCAVLYILKTFALLVLCINFNHSMYSDIQTFQFKQ